ncbi:DUF2946 domain-containing protein [Stenotrophomonas sp. JC08]|uniref:DUF2946 domain-containing protein n=1 Tax=Stenotrophomonas sp. JC08 TaxID=3445779 RepID=UPI003FA2BA3B
MQDAFNYNAKMIQSSASFRRMAWLALVAVLLTVVAPTVSRVLMTTVSKTSPILMEMCSTVGLKTIDVSALIGSEESVRPMMVMDDACGYCVLATPLPLVLALLVALLLRPPQAPALHFFSLRLRTPRNMRGLGSQAPPRAL